MDLGVAQGTVARWETGDRHCPIERLIEYAAIFGKEFKLTDRTPAKRGKKRA